MFAFASEIQQIKTLMRIMMNKDPKVEFSGQASKFNATALICDNSQVELKYANINLQSCTKLFGHFVIKPVPCSPKSMLSRIMHRE